MGIFFWVGFFFKKGLTHPIIYKIHYRVRFGFCQCLLCDNLVTISQTLNENHSQNDSHLQNAARPRRSAVTKRYFKSRQRRQCSSEAMCSLVCVAALYPQVIHKSLRGYPARHPSIVARIFALVKGKLKIIWRDICSLLC